MIMPLSRCTGTVARLFDQILPHGHPLVLRSLVVRAQSNAPRVCSDRRAKVERR